MMKHKDLMVKIGFALLCVLMGLVFLYSGYTKLGFAIPGIKTSPIEPFEYTFVDMGFSWTLAPIVARLMIGLEFFIGFMLILNLYTKLTMKLTVATLLLLSAYLVIILVKQGNNGNCGCFGTALVMTPRQALIKNGIMLALCLLIYRFYNGFRYDNFGKWLAGLLFITAFALPHALNYIDYDYSEAYLHKPEDTFPLELDTLYKHATIHTPPQSLRKGKHIIAFMSLSCPHCRIAAKKLRIMKELNPNIPVYFVLNGDKEKLRDFYEDTKSQNIPYCQLNGKSFVYLAGLSMPMIYLVNNSVVENYVNYMELDQGEIEKWLAKP